MHFNEVWGNNFGLVVEVQSMIELRWLVGWGPARIMFSCQPPISHQYCISSSSSSSSFSSFSFSSSFPSFSFSSCLHPHLKQFSHSSPPIPQKLNNSYTHIFSLFTQNSFAKHHQSHFSNILPLFHSMEKNYE